MAFCKWLELPATDKEIKQAFKNIEVAEMEEYEEQFISDYETDIKGLKMGEYESLNLINELMKEVGRLNSYEILENLYKEVCADDVIDYCGNCGQAILASEEIWETQGRSYCGYCIQQVEN